MPTSFTERNYPFEVILSEANGSQSREVVTIVSGANLKAGAVLGKITASGKYNEADQGAATGIETAVAVLLEDVDASGGDAPGLALVRNAEVKSALLNYKSGQSGGNQATSRSELAAVGIICR